MKKAISVILAAVMVLSLAACGGSAKRPKKEIDENTVILTLALRSGTYSDVIQSCLYEFEEANNVYCEVLEMEEDELHSGVVEDAAKPEGAYDLCMVDGSWMAEYTAKGVLANLSSLGYELDEDIIPATTEICYSDGDIYLAPYYGNVTVLLYNKAIVEGAGYKDGKTIDSLEDIKNICDYAKGYGNIGFMYRGDSANNYVVDFLPFLLSYGGWVVDENNRPTVDTPEFRQALSFYMGIASSGDAAPRDDLVMAIANGAAAMGVGWPGWYTPNKKSSADYSAISGKVTADSPAFNANVYGVWTIGIPANSKNKELAEKLLEHLMDPEVQKSTVAAGGVPCRYSSLRDREILEEFPQYEVVCKALEGGVYRPIMEEWSDFYTILGAEMENIMKGDKSMDQGLADAQAKLEEMLSSK